MLALSGKIALPYSGLFEYCCFLLSLINHPDTLFQFVRLCNGKIVLSDCNLSFLVFAYVWAQELRNLYFYICRFRSIPFHTSYPSISQDLPDVHILKNEVGFERFPLFEIVKMPWLSLYLSCPKIAVP